MLGKLQRSDLAEHESSRSEERINTEVVKESCAWIALLCLIEESRGGVHPPRCCDLPVEQMEH